MAKFF
jgi:hypothetical protein